MTAFRNWLVFVLFLAAAGAVEGQTIVSGRVTDSQTGESLAGVYVIWGKGSGTSTTMVISHLTQMRAPVL